MNFTSRLCQTLAPTAAGRSTRLTLTSNSRLRSRKPIHHQFNVHVGRCGCPAWLHALIGQEAIAYVIDPTRSGAVAEAILGLDYDGTMIHDGWSPYGHFEDAQHQQCLNHLLRRADEMAATATREAVCFRAAWPNCYASAWICATALRRQRSAGTAWPWPVATWRTSCPI